MNHRTYDQQAKIDALAIMFRNFAKEYGYEITINDNSFCTRFISYAFVNDRETLNVDVYIDEIDDSIYRVFEGVVNQVLKRLAATDKKEEKNMNNRMYITYTQKEKLNSLEDMLRDFAKSRNYMIDTRTNNDGSVRFTFYKGYLTSTITIVPKDLNNIFDGFKEISEYVDERLQVETVSPSKYYRDYNMKAAAYFTEGLNASLARYKESINSVLYGSANSKKLGIKDVIFNDPATIVFWRDGSKTVIRCGEHDTYDPEKGLAMAICKKQLGNKHDYYNTFIHWLRRAKK